MVLSKWLGGCFFPRAQTASTEGKPFPLFLNHFILTSNTFPPTFWSLLFFYPESLGLPT